MKTSNTPSTAPRTAVAQVHELPNLPFPEIKVLWRKLFGGETPTHNRQFLAVSYTHLTLPTSDLV